MTGVPSVAETTYSSVLVYDGSPQCSRNYLLFCPRLRLGPQCSRNYLLFCPRLRRGPQCSRNYLFFCPRLRGSLVQQELLTLLSSSMTGVPSVAGTTYSSVLVYDGDPQCSRNYLLFCPRLRRESLVQQELLTLLSSLVYLFFCPRLRGSLVQQELLTLLSSSTTGVPSPFCVAGTTYSSVLVYDGGPQCSRNYLFFCPRLRRESLVQQELLILLSSSMMGVPCVA